MAKTSDNKFKQAGIASSTRSSVLAKTEVIQGFLKIYREY